MRLFLSSWRLDERAQALTQLVGAGARTAVLLNAFDNLGDFPVRSIWRRNAVSLSCSILPRLSLTFGRITVGARRSRLRSTE
jgi:hypothetical protein